MPKQKQRTIGFMLAFSVATGTVLGHTIPSTTSSLFTGTTQLHVAVPLREMNPDYWNHEVVSPQRSTDARGTIS